MNWQALASLVGRALVGLVYVGSGVDKIVNWEATAQLMASERMPMIEVLHPAAIVLEIVAGLAVAVGFQTRLAALALALFSIVATLIFNHFWNMPGEIATLVMHLFSSTIAMFGACLFIVGMGAGPISVDAATAKTREAKPAAA